MKKGITKMENEKKEKRTALTMVKERLSDGKEYTVSEMKSAVDEEKQFTATQISIALNLLVKDGVASKERKGKKFVYANGVDKEKAG